MTDAHFGAPLPHELAGSSGPMSERRHGLPRSRVVASLAALAAGVPRGTRAQPIPVRMGVLPVDPYATIHFAQDKGFFSDAGLDVQLTVVGSSPRMMEAMAGNDIDIATADVIQVGSAFNRGLPFAVFWTTGLYRRGNSMLALCVARSSTVQAAKDLQDQTIACVALTSLSTLALREWLRRNGVDESKVKLVEMPFSAMTAAVGRGTVAAALLVEPFVT